MKSYFDEPYWNLTQVLAWVLLGDRDIVHQASSDYRGKRTYWTEVKGVDGQPEMVEMDAGRMTDLTLCLLAAHRQWQDRQASEPSADAARDEEQHGKVRGERKYEAAKSELRDALLTGRIAATGVKVETRDRVHITGSEWADLDVFFDDAGEPYAGIRHSSGRGIKRFELVRIASETVLENWPPDRELTTQERLQRDAEALAAKWQGEGRSFTKRDIAEELAKSSGGKTKPGTIERNVRDTWSEGPRRRGRPPKRS